jgi:hypothetical protein
MLYTNSFYIDYLLKLKDDEIDYFNKDIIHSIFTKYMNKKITKEFLLDKHSERNKLFIHCKFYNTMEIKLLTLKACN